MTDFNWPVDENGKPFVKISFGASEKINLGNYNSLEVGPANISRFVKDDDSLAESFNKCYDEVEEVMKDLRDKAYKLRMEA